eukprot:g15980.t1
MTCAEDRECEPGLRCNVGEPQPRCRKLFSLKIGALAAEDVFCEFGWRDRDGKCAPPAQSKQAGRSCDTDLDCETTDETGRTGSCTCKAWWDKDDPKYCKPVSGDFAKHQEALRDYLWFRASRCGTFWTEAECLRIFGNEAMRLKLAVECEEQQLSGGPYAPPEECRIVDSERFGDRCAMMNELGLLQSLADSFHSSQHNRRSSHDFGPNLQCLHDHIDAIGSHYVDGVMPSCGFKQSKRELGHNDLGVGGNTLEP